MIISKNDPRSASFCVEICDIAIRKSFNNQLFKLSLVFIYNDFKFNIPLTIKDDSNNLHWFIIKPENNKIYFKQETFRSTQDIKTKLFQFEYINFQFMLYSEYDRKNLGFVDFSVDINNSNVRLVNISNKKINLLSYAKKKKFEFETHNIVGYLDINFTIDSEIYEDNSNYVADSFYLLKKCCSNDFEKVCINDSECATKPNLENLNTDFKFDSDINKSSSLQSEYENFSESKFLLNEPVLESKSEITDFILIHNDLAHNKNKKNIEGTLKNGENMCKIDLPSQTTFCDSNNCQLVYTTDQDSNIFENEPILTKVTSLKDEIHKKLTSKISKPCFFYDIHSNVSLRNENSQIIENDEKVSKNCKDQRINPFNHTADQDSENIDMQILDEEKSLDDISKIDFSDKLIVLEDKTTDSSDTIMQTDHRNLKQKVKPIAIDRKIEVFIESVDTNKKKNKLMCLRQELAMLKNEHQRAILEIMSDVSRHYCITSNLTKELADLQNSNREIHNNIEDLKRRLSSLENTS